MFEGRNDYVEMTGADYCKLYARYVGRNLDKLILAGGPVEGKRVLDLCAGSGVVGLRAKELGAAFVMAHDRSRKMMKGLFDKGIDAISDECDDNTVVLPTRPHNLSRHNFDVVICRQAVNYWWCSHGLGEVMFALKPGGRFVFNTFHGDNWTGPGRPTTTEYEIDGVAFAEVHWFVDNTIHHVQCRAGMLPHCTTFDYIPRGVFAGELDNQPVVKSWTVERNGNTDIYVVEKADEKK